MLNNVAPIREPLINIPQSIAREIVSAVYNVGDFMKEENARLTFVSNNHKPGLFWSKLNTNVHQAVGITANTSVIVRAGYYEFLLVVQEGATLTFMRETRFKDVRADARKKRKLSYQNLLVQRLNVTLKAENSQMSLFPILGYNEAELSERFSKLFKNVHGCIDAGYYVMVLFDIDSFYTLQKIRAVLVDPNFDIVEEQDWSHFIPVTESIIVEKVSDTASPSNNPSRGLSLSLKALAKKSRQKNLSLGIDNTTEND